MLRIFICIFLSVFSFASANAYDEDVGIVAVVNDEAISSIDVKNRLDVAVMSSGLQLTQDTKAKLFSQVLQLLIDERLNADEAKKLGISVSNEELDAAVASLEEKNHIKPGGFDAFMKANGVSPAVVKQQVKASLLRNKIISREIVPKAVVTDREVEERIENISSQSGIAEFNVSEIVLPVDSPSDEKKVKELADKLVNEIGQGSKFNSIAREFSRSTSAATGGDIGWVQQDSMAKEIYAGLANLPAGEIAGPIRTADGYYIVKLNDRRALLGSNKDDTEIGIRQAFVPLDTDVSKRTEEVTVARIQKERAKVTSCEQFDDFAIKVNSTMDPNLVMTQLTSLNEDIRGIVEKVNVGSTSPVIRSESGLHVIMVCEKTEAAPSLAIKSKIRDFLIRNKVNMQTQRMAKELRRKAFIDIRI